jgi:hypothetical protein
MPKFQFTSNFLEALAPLGNSIVDYHLAIPHFQQAFP